MVEKYRKHVFCQKGFLKDCASRLTDKSISRVAPSALLFGNEIKDLILSPIIKLYLDYSKEEFENLVKAINKRQLNEARKGQKIELNYEENLIFEIYNLQQVGNLHLHFTEINIENKSWMNASCEKQNPLFLIDRDTDYAQRLQEEYGIIVIGNQDYKKLEDLLRDNSFAIHRSETVGWKDILYGKQFSCNCLILIDNYVLNDTQTYNENIREIFETLLPQKLVDCITFQILIVTTLRQDKRHDLDCECRYRQISDIINEIRPCLKYELSILKNDGSLFHDRTIITNYAYISCGAGFTLFKNGKSQRTTTIMDFEIYLNPRSLWLTDAYTNLLSDLHKVYSSAPKYYDYAMPYFLMGKKENRIIDEYSYLLTE